MMLASFAISRRHRQSLKAEINIVIEGVRAGEFQAVVRGDTRVL